MYYQREIPEKRQLCCLFFFKKKMPTELDRFKNNLESMSSRHTEEDFRKLNAMCLYLEKHTSCTRASNLMSGSPSWKLVAISKRLNMRARRHGKDDRIPNPLPKKKVKENHCYFGHYWCRACRKEWCSAWAWKGWYQECLRCGRKVQAYEYEEKQRGRGDGGVHREDKCQRCMAGQKCLNTVVVKDEVDDLIKEFANM